MGFLRVIVMLVALGGCASESIAPAQVPATGATGALSFDTAGSFLRGSGHHSLQSSTVSLTGTLQMPAGSGPFPAIVVAHGCNGNRNTERAWGPTLRSWGYATFVIDSFSGRGLTEVCTNMGLSPLQRIPDAYGALRLLAALPQIDPKRIALMGFSHGGALTMLAATAWAKETFVSTGAPAFRAFFPFYPNCNADFPERKRVSAPVRIHTGEADDWTPAKPCAELAAALKAAGQDVQIHVYPGAQHGFDQSQRQAFLPNVNNGSGCFPQMASILGPVAPRGVAGCVKKGATLGPHPAAAAQARANLRAQLDELIK